MDKRMRHEGEPGDGQVKELFAGKKVLLKGLRSKAREDLKLRWNSQRKNLQIGKRNEGMETLAWNVIGIEK